MASRHCRAVQSRQAARELNGELGVRGRAPLGLPGNRKQVAGTGQHSAGPASGLPGGLRQVSGQVSWASLFYFVFFSNYFSFLFCRFVLYLVLKPIQFILLLTIFLGAKRIKTMLHKIFQNYWTYIYLIVDINPIQIIIDLIQMPKLDVSETPKILVWILPLANISRGYQEHFLGHI